MGAKRGNEPLTLEKYNRTAHFNFWELNKILPHENQQLKKSQVSTWSECDEGEE